VHGESLSSLQEPGMVDIKLGSPGEGSIGLFLIQMFRKRVEWFTRIHIGGGCAITLRSQAVDSYLAILLELFVAEVLGESSKCHSHAYHLLEGIFLGFQVTIHGKSPRQVLVQLLFFTTIQK